MQPKFIHENCCVGEGPERHAAPIHGNFGNNAAQVKALSDMQPQFMRFPGGAFVEGVDLGTALRCAQSSVLTLNSNSISSDVHRPLFFGSTSFEVRANYHMKALIWIGYTLCAALGTDSREKRFGSCSE
eukprot:1100323-Pelagomonas_calceolata.AAC.5